MTCVHSHRARFFSFRSTSVRSVSRLCCAVCSVSPSPCTTKGHLRHSAAPFAPSSGAQRRQAYENESLRPCAAGPPFHPLASPLVGAAVSPRPRPVSPRAEVRAGSLRDWVRALLALPQLTEEGRRRRELRQQLTEEIAEDTRPMDPRVRDLLLSPAPPSVREGERVVAVFVGAECAPWSKAGGLGDVLQALPTSLAQRGHIVLTVTPRYAPYPDVPSAGVRVPLELPSEALRGFGPGGSHALLYARVQGGVVRVFVDHPVFGAHVGRGAHVVYGTGYSDGEAEMVLMYSVMCQAALAAPVVLRDKARADAGLPGEAHPGAPLPRLVYVMNDWPSAPLALRLRRHVQTGIMATRYRRILGRRGQGFSSSVLGADRGGVSLSGSSDSETEALLVRAAQSWGPMSDSDLLRLRATAGATAGAGGGLAGHRMTRNQRWAMRMCQFAERLEAATTDAKLVLCVHNMAYQGRLPAATFADLCLPEQALEDVLHMPSWVKALDKGAGAGLRGGGLARTRPTTVGTGLEELDSGVAAMVLADRVDAVAASEPATPSQGIEVRQLDGAEGRREANGGDGAGDGSGGRRDGGGGETAVLVRFGEEVEDPAWRRAKQEARGWAKEQRSVRAGCSGGLSVGAGGRGRMPSARRVLQGAAMRRADASINWMQGAVRVADLRLTVSPTYAEEIGGGGMAGAGLTEAVLESGGIAGITNGLDLEEWDPSLDTYLPQHARYTIDSVDEGKRACKAFLQRELGLILSENEPLVCFVGRLEDQKGVDLIVAGLPALMAPRPASLPSGLQLPPMDDPLVLTALGAPGAMPYQPSGLMRKALQLLAEVQREHLVTSAPEAPKGRTVDGRSFTHPQVVVLGTGKEWLERSIKDLSNSYPGRAVGLPKFDVRLSHLLIAAADFCLIPSRFEPCGLVAQCAMRYGTIPLAASVGGMRDFIPETAGYFMGSLSARGAPGQMAELVTQLVFTVQDALADYGTEEFRRRRRECMACDMGWRRPAELWSEALVGLATMPARREA